MRPIYWAKYVGTRVETYISKGSVVADSMKENLLAHRSFPHERYIVLPLFF